MRRFPTLLLLVALAACGGPGDARQARTQASASAGATAGASLVAVATDGATTGSSKDETAKAGQGKGGVKALPSGPADHNTMPLKVTVKSTCVTPGGSMEATAVSLKNSRLAFAAAYDDNTLPPDFTYVPDESNTTGTFTWTWIVKPTVPPGPALLTVVASHDDEGATFNMPFRVARAC